MSITRRFGRGLANRGRWGLLAIWLGLTASVLALAFGWLIQRRAAADLAAAQDSLARNEWTEAYDRLVANPGRMAQADLLASGIARRLERYADAEALLTQFEARAGVTAESEREWILLGAQQGDFCENAPTLHALANSGSADAVLILEALARGYVRITRWPDAIRCLDQLQELEPNQVTAFILRGQIAMTFKNLEQARDHYAAALRLYPRHLEARLGLADASYRLGYVQAAADLYRESQRGHGGRINGAAVLGLARCEFDSGRMAESAELLSRLQREEPALAAAWVEGGRVALHQDEPEGAERQLRQAVKLAPWHREAWELLGLAFELQGNRAAAAACGGRRLKLEESDGVAARLSLRYRNEPRNLDLRKELAQWCEQNGEDERALRLRLASLWIDPGHCPAHRALAAYFERVGQPRRAALHRQMSKSVSAWTRP